MPDPQEILVDVASRKHPELDRGLLEEVHRVQEEHQYDEDPQAAMDRVRRTVEAWVAGEARRRKGDT